MKTGLKSICGFTSLELLPLSRGLLFIDYVNYVQIAAFLASLGPGDLGIPSLYLALCVVTPGKGRI
jgi:hypothetical protein